MRFVALAPLLAGALLLAGCGAESPRQAGARVAVEESLAGVGVRSRADALHGQSVPLVHRARDRRLHLRRQAARRRVRLVSRHAEERRLGGRARPSATPTACCRSEQGYAERVPARSRHEPGTNTFRVGRYPRSDELRDRTTASPLRPPARRALRRRCRRGGPRIARRPARRRGRPARLRGAARPSHAAAGAC